MTCTDVAQAAGLDLGRRSGQEQLYRCPRHDDQHPSLSVNSNKDRWLCGPCGASGAAWQLAAFIAGVDAGDKRGVKQWLQEHGLSSNGNAASMPCIVAKYPYHDANGVHLYDVVRFDPKDFRQRKPDGTWNLAGVRRVVYRLPELLRAEDVFIAEGEKDVDELRSIGLTATCNPGGAGKWRSEYSDSFTLHQYVVVIPDNDEPGRKHAQQVAESLAGKVASLKILELSGLPAKGDVSDWLRDKDPTAAAAELARLAEAAPEWKNPDTTEPATYIEFAPAFNAAVDPPIEYLVNELLPAGVLALLHGEPRTRKSWAALDVAIAVATGTAAFNLERFSVPKPAPVLYLSQEDGARLVRIRNKALLRGRGMETAPSTLAFGIHQGINIESPEWQERLIEDVKRHGFRLIVFDPIRRFAANVDKGPAEVSAITAFLRRLVNESGATVLLVHHDVKPPANGQDTRRRSQKASGGDWFASSECPIAFELAGETTVAYPESFKLSNDPDPFSFELQTDDARQPVRARLIGQSTTSGAAANIATDTAVTQYLNGHPGSSQRNIMRSLKKGSDTVAESLERLFNADNVDCVDLGRGKGKKWTLRR